MSAYRYTTIGFLSDYGLSDEFVGVCHGVIRRLAPEATVIDITHGIEAHNVTLGALALSQAVTYLPTGVHLAVVDPGVGTRRLGVVLQTADGSCLVGPDNGLLLAAARRLGGATGCHRLENPALRAARVAPTFHGRDIFAPAAAHLARGVEPEAFGREVPLDALTPSAIPGARVEGGACSGVVLQVDRFGNLATSISAPDAQEAALAPGAMAAITLGGHRLLVPYGVTFASVASGEAVLIEDAQGLLALCVNQSSAARRFGAGPGDVVTLAPAG